MRFAISEGQYPLRECFYQHCATDMLILQVDLFSSHIKLFSFGIKIDK